jgi:hypothetical protein
MKDTFREILESIPPKNHRSKLEPYTELIDQLRRRGRTYREIARILAEKCDLIVASSTLVRYVAARSRNKRKPPKDHESRKVRCTVPTSVEVNVASAVPDDDPWKRIELLKHQPAKSVQPSKQFEYDPSQPLQLPRKK